MLSVFLFHNAENSGAGAGTGTGTGTGTGKPQRFLF